MPLTEPAVHAAIVAICTSSFLEGTGVPWPGVYIVAGAAAVMERSVQSVAITTALAAVCYVLGALVQYGVGYLFGERALALLPAKQRAQLVALSDRWGPALVCLSRPFAIGNYVSLPAGLVRMPLLRFVAYTAAGILPWGAGAATVGQLLGDQVGPVLNRITEWLMPASLALGALGVLWVLWKWRSGAFRGLRRACPEHQTHHSRR